MRWWLKTHSQHRQIDQEEQMCWWLKTCSQHWETDQEDQMCWWLKTCSQHWETDKKEAQMLWSLETGSQNWQKMPSVYPHGHPSTALRQMKTTTICNEQAIFSGVSCQAKSERTFINSLWKNTLFVSQNQELFKLSLLNTHHQTCRIMLSMYACNNQAKADISQTRSHRKYTTVHKFPIFYL